jgi:hypothetical protein
MTAPCTCGVKFTGGLCSSWCDSLRPAEPVKPWHGPPSDLLQRFAAAAVAAAPAIPLSAFPPAWPNYNVGPPASAAPAGFTGPYYVDAIHTDLNGARTYMLADRAGGPVIRAGVPEARLCATGGAPGAGPFYGCDEVWVQLRPTATRPLQSFALQPKPPSGGPKPTPNADGTHVDDVICMCGSYIVNKSTGHYDGQRFHFDKGCV